MPMTKDEIAAAKADLDQDVVRAQKAEEQRLARERGEWSGLDQPKQVKDAILDPDPLMAAWLWAKEHFIIPNEENYQTCMSLVVPSHVAGYELEVRCWDKRTVAKKVLLLVRLEGHYKVAAVVDQWALDASSPR